VADPLIPTHLPDDDTEEVAHYDDATIGRAFRWSLVILALTAAVGFGGWLVFRPRAAPPPPPPAPLSAPPSRPEAQVEIPAARFTDITAEAGISFVHANGAIGEKLLPETMGGGVAFFDFDNDGNPDLLFINSTSWPWTAGAGENPPTAALYRNTGGGKFQDVTAGSGLDVPIYGMGVAVGDYDNDGWVDVLITSVGGNRLFRNQGGERFREVTREAGVGGDPTDWSTCAAWLDYDNDGDLDLFVGNYIRWSREIDARGGLQTRRHRSGIWPANELRRRVLAALSATRVTARFTEVSAEAGIQVRNPATGVPLAKPLGVVPIDLDGDGWMDLVVANDTVQNLVFLNRRDGTFQEIGTVAEWPSTITGTRAAQWASMPPAFATMITSGWSSATSPMK
jgi:enediyne biosynthesis protein E4